MPDIVLQTSMFDKKDFDGRSKSQSLQKLPAAQKAAKQTPQASASIIETVDERQSSLNKDLQLIEDLTPETIMETQSNYKLLLRCMRIWKIYAK